MNSAAQIIDDTFSEQARRRLLALDGDPFLYADWERVVFLHYLVAPELLRPSVPHPFELDLCEGRGCISVVAVTMQNFRPCGSDPAAILFRPVRQQRFLNLRTYVHCGGEPGALFLQGWLSQPLPVPLPSGFFHLPYAFASCLYQHAGDSGEVRGRVTTRDGNFAYHASMDPACEQRTAEPGSLAEFTMERYTGVFSRGHQPYVFRAWHPPWLQNRIEATIEDDSLLRSKFRWWQEAQYAGGSFAPGCKRVWLGKAHRWPGPCQAAHKRRVLSSFFELP
jgi:uncharacterized protein YqjF (DUF2071 family)